MTTEAIEIEDLAITHDIGTMDWRRVAAILAEAPLVVRDPAAVARAYRNSFDAAFAWHGAHLIGVARAVSDGVFYATIYDVAVDPAWQGVGVGRRLMEALLARLPCAKIFLTSVPGKQGFYDKLGFLRLTNAMGLYADGVREAAVARGVLLAPEDLASPRVLAISR
jgi:ribosomal protein S18 acetylase RimI-like enzyme